MEEEPMYVTDISMNYFASVEEEEKYRLQALDYSLRPVAVKVKEQIDDKGGGVSSHKIHSHKDVSSGSLDSIHDSCCYWKYYLEGKYKKY